MQQKQKPRRVNEYWAARPRGRSWRDAAAPVCCSLSEAGFSHEHCRARTPKQVGIQRIIQRGPDMTEQVEAWLATEQEDEQS
jgi:hypothetical protein